MKYLLSLLTVLTFLNPSTFASDHYIIRQTPTIMSPNFVLMDAASGLVLAERCAECKVQPDSLTKLMPLFILSEELDKGNISQEDLVPISIEASKADGSKMFVNPGSKVSIDDLMNGMIVSSGNDATYAISEYLGGNEHSFVTMMNDMAKKIGLKNTHFENSTGLPNKEQHSSPLDMAHLAQHIINDHPQYYTKYAQKTFSYNKITQKNRNALLWADDRIDGMKTGFTNEAGYCLVSSAKQNDLRLIAVVMGSKNEKIRKSDSLSLLNYGFRFYKLKHIPPKTISTSKVWYGSKDLQIGLNKHLSIIVPRFNDEEIKATASIQPNLIAPIAKNTQVGKISFSYKNHIIQEFPLVAMNDVSKKFYLFRIFDNLQIRWNNFWYKEKI